MGKPLKKFKPFTGLFIATVVVLSWVVSIILLMNWRINWYNPFLYLAVVVQMHLYTGLFITAHDAMHGTVSANRKINDGIGYLCTFLYASFWYPQLFTKHHRHHKYVHTENDPDYHAGSFVSWYATFIRSYLSIWQVVLMALIFNILKKWIAQPNLVMFWVLPSLLSTIQLFYFGTYLPHKGEHQNTHQSCSQPKNHLLAFLSCYFFGYHYEHHQWPQTPWWQLWKMK